MIGKGQLDFYQVHKQLGMAISDYWKAYDGLD